MWPDPRYLELVGIEHPIIQAPMAGANSAPLAIAVSQAGGLGSLPCALLSPEQTRVQLDIISQQTRHPVNVNFFCHTPPAADAAREQAWYEKLAPYYAELGLDVPVPAPGAGRKPFDEALCELMVEMKPRVISFHFGLPESRFIDRLKAAGCIIQSSATSVAEACWLEARGADAVIAQGFEAGGHRGMFLSSDLTSQVGTFALVPQVVDAVQVPVIAAGGIADARGIAAAMVLGASAVQIGTAYLFCPEAEISALHRQALQTATADATALTNIFSGRPARSIRNRIINELGPISAEAPEFPLAASAIQPLRSAAENRGSSDFSQLWSGQAASLGSARTMGAAELTRTLAAEAQLLCKKNA